MWTDGESWIMESSDRCNLNVRPVPQFSAAVSVPRAGRLFQPRAPNRFGTQEMRKPVWSRRRICCEVVVSLVLLTHVFAAGSLVSAGCCCLIEMAMVSGIRRGLTGWQTADLGRDIVVTFRSHRRFYPASRLRRAFIASSILLGFCIAGLILVYRVANGM